MSVPGRSPLSLAGRLLLLTGVLGLLLLGAGAGGLACGSSSLGLQDVIALLCGDPLPEFSRTILWQIRLPRVILAGLAGATLSLGGLVFQALFRNPLAEPYILGISGGSAVGAIAAMLAGFSPFPGVALAAFCGSLLVLLLVLTIGGGSRAHSNALLLGGVMMNAFCSALIMFLISLSESSQVHHMLFWLMGDLAIVDTARLPILLLCLPCFLVIMLMARPLNLLLMGREGAAALGVNVRRVSLLLLVVTTLMVSLVVCQCGLIGFVGLVAPHIFRQLLGADHRLLVPASVLGGASFLIFCDVLSRTLPAGGEMPVGIITAMTGAPLFVFLLWRARP